MQSVATDFFAAGGIHMSLLILTGCILGLIFIPGIIECFPSLLAAVVRWKESENINYAAKISRSRTRSCIALTIPFLLVSARYCLFSPAANPSPLMQLGITAAAMLGWLLVRLLMTAIFKSRHMRKDAWQSAVKCPESFFCILSGLMLVSAAVFHFTACPDEIAREIILWEIGVLYLLSIIRETQIFVHYRGGFSGFLYLCTLELIPSGLLIAADLIY